MFRPFPADRLVRLLRGKKGAVVLERADQPLAVDAPLLREIRAALAKAVENGRFGNGTRPHPAVEACPPDAVPAFYSGCFGMGSRDLQPGDLVAAFENMFPGGTGQRQFYLGIDFIRKGATHPSVKEWQAKIEGAYPGVGALALESKENVDLLPSGSLAVRIHSVGGWGAITMGKNLTMTLFDLLGMYVKSNPKYGSEKKGQPTTFYGVFAHDPVRLNCELRHVDVVLSPDPNVFRHSDALAGIREGGALIIQHDGDPAALWKNFPSWAQKKIRDRKVRVFFVDGFGIARAETDVADLQYRMQGAAFQGAFFKASPIMERENLDEPRLFEAIRKQLEKKFGHRGKKVVEDNVRVIRRGFDEVKELDWAGMDDSAAEAPADTAITAPWYLGETDTVAGIGDPHRFAGQVCALYRAGEDPIADPFAALSAIPAATGVFRDMTDIRFEVPEFIPDRCTGCAQCWVQCPDAAIPGLVSELDTVLKLAVREAGNGNGNTRMAGLVEPLARESRRLLREEAVFTTFASVVARAYTAVAGELKLAESERSALDAEFSGVESVLADLPLARTAPFFTVPERKEEGGGGLLSITINPYACKGCNLCVEVCPDQALVTVKQDATVVDKLKRNWARWNTLPDTPDRFLQIANLDEGIGVLSSLLLKKENFESMIGGDGSCMGCGEKTGVHLIVAAIEAHMQPRVAAFVKRLDTLIEQLEETQSRLILATTDLETMAETGPVHVDVELADADRARLARIGRLQKTLKDLRWRYTSGPSGRGRASVGITNATGCSSVWGSTYPYNPYPYPWTNHLFQDAPSVAIGIFEGLMRKMADGFTAVRKAELEAEDAYDPAAHDPFFEAFTWREFSDDEFRMCPPVMAIGGDGAMLDIGFQNVSRLMASGKPIRILMLDTQVYSNTGGQACTSGFLGQISDMAAYGAARHGKEEQRKEMGLIAMAHRNTFVLQSSQALPSHLIGGVLKGLNSRHPAIFNLYSPCQAEHGLPDSGSAKAAKLALESRAFPFFVYDPDGGPGLAGKLDLEGNPELEATWPEYELVYLDDGAERTITLPLTVPDWAATEPRFARHFKKVDRSRWDETMVPVHEYLEMGPADREGKTPFIHVLDDEKRLARLSVSHEMIELTEDRLVLWDEIKEMAGAEVPDAVAKRLTSPVQREYEAKIKALQAEYEGKMADLKKTYPARITRRIAEALVGGNGDVLSGLTGAGTAVRRPAPRPAAAPAAAPAPAPAAPAPAAAAVAEAPAETEALPAPAEEAEVVEPYIDTELCTSCNDCLQISKQLFAYDGEKRAYIKDPRGGTFQQLVRAAEKCPARVIHPGTPLDPDEPDLDKWVERAKPFN
jgi:pyruvate-ferredoxin/flavodoxin oxidoreductase